MLDPHIDATKSSIQAEYELAESPAKVWRALTEPELLGAWLMPNDIQPQVGYCFTFHSEPMPGWDGIVHCRILEVEPQKRLVYTWQGGSQKSEGSGHELDTILTWTLTPTLAGGTTLRLEHSGFHPDSFALKIMGQGWSGKIAQRISKVLEDRLSNGSC
jgi:uncharacterized protein YndB with AHSA1/START domain